MNRYIIGIGAANIDIHGHSRDAINLYDSNPGKMHVSCGGVTRNILENYARLGGESVLMTVVGDDLYGRKIIADCEESGINCDHVQIVRGVNTSTYMDILNNTGDMVLALSDMTIMEKMTVDYLRNNDKIISGSSLIVCDPSIPEAVMDHLLATYSDRIPIFVDPVSIAYSKCIKDKIAYFHTAKPNVLEAEVLSGLKIGNREELIRAGEAIVEKGLNVVVISLGKDGCLYCDRHGHRFYTNPEKAVVRNVTGAGDAFMAGLICSYMNGYDIDETLHLADNCARMALLSEDTINKNMSLEAVNTLYRKEQE